MSPDDPGDDPDDPGDEPPAWSPDGSSGDDEPEDEPAVEFPAISVELPAPKGPARAVLRVLVAGFALAAGAAGLFLGKSALVAETMALLALTLGALALPALAVFRRVRGYPERGTFLLERSGFKLPWLGPEAPGPEGPWEALRSYEVTEGGRTGRVLVLEVAAGRFVLSDRLLGQEAFVAAAQALERALGPEGVLLGTVVRLPVTPEDARPPLERAKPKLMALGVAALFIALASAGTGIFVKVIAGVAAFIAILAGNVAVSWNRSPGADIVLALDGLVVPLPPDLRRAVKLPFAALRRGAVEERPTGAALVFEHERGKLSYPLTWFEPGAVREFVRQLSLRGRA